MSRTSLRIVPAPADDIASKFAALQALIERVHGMTFACHSMAATAAALHPTSDTEAPGNEGAVIAYLALRANDLANDADAACAAAFAAVYRKPETDRTEHARAYA